MDTGLNPRAPGGRSGARWGGLGEGALGAKSHEGRVGETETG